MQPELPAESPAATSETTTQSNLDDTQHGLRKNDTTAPSSPADEDVGQSTTRTAEQLVADAALAASRQDDEDAHSTLSRALRPRNTPSPPAGIRIAEYEQASTPPIRKREGPGFEIIHKHRSASDKRSPIQELPNEVLTHALAHLAPTDLTSVSLVSKRFHDLVTGPHAWRSAFAHFFPGAQSLNAALHDDSDDVQEVILSEKRVFTRLTVLASWRSEYIMRTRLLRSLLRGKPVQTPTSSNSSRSGHGNTATSTIMYGSQLFTTINHLHATFGSGTNKRFPRFIHGADDTGTATRSDPSAAKVDHWGLSDPQLFLQFAERFPGDEQYGLGPGEVVGVPNVMDVSQPYGMVHGEGSPGGMTYYRSADEMRGRFLLFSSALSAPDLGIPRILSNSEAITAVWIAKSAYVVSLTEGLIGILSGSSLGVLTAYSLGSTSGGNNRDHRFTRGEMTARWVLSPGVPIIAIAIDNEYSLKRYAQNRIWAVVLNALGEVFFLTKFPKRPHIDRGTQLSDEAIEQTAWVTGRSVYWNSVEPSRRTAKLDPYTDSSVDGSYSPRSSWNGMCLSKEQIQSETREIETFATKKPKDFQKSCFGWDMRRKLEVDFAGDDGNNAGENVVVFECGLEEGTVPAIKRYTRCRVQEKPALDATSTPPLTVGSSETSSPPSLFGVASPPSPKPMSTFAMERLKDSLEHDELFGSITPRPLSEEWRTSSFALRGLKHVSLLVTTMDNSIFATQTISEDPLLNFSARSTNSSPSLTPMSPMGNVVQPTDIPGQRSRLLATGTHLGSVVLWDIRAPISGSIDQVNIVEPVRIIHTDSPQISCLALSSLYLVHGGNDGLVQAWDPLASNMQPVRTLHSRFTARARRRLIQAQASPQGVGINLFAAGAVCLDPDSTVLRGMVSLGLHLLYWSYSSSAADHYKSHKRRARRSERGSNNGGERFSGGARSNLKDYIANERFELDRENAQRNKDSHRFAGRFGTELLDGSEEEMIAYAAMLSQESLEQENQRRVSETGTPISTHTSKNQRSGSAFSDSTPTPSASPSLSGPKTDEELDADIAEAIRQSLASSPSTYDVPIRPAKPRNHKRSSAKSSPSVSPPLAGSSKSTEMSDLEFALQLSLAEQQSKGVVKTVEADMETIPSHSTAHSGDKGKGKTR